MKTTSVRRAKPGQPVSYKHPLTNFFIKLVFSTFQSLTMPKKREKHDEIDFDKVNKILVETNIDLKKVSQWNIVVNKYYNFTNLIRQEKIRHL